MEAMEELHRGSQRRGRLFQLLYKNTPGKEGEGGKTRLNYGAELGKEWAFCCPLQFESATLRASFPAALPPLPQLPLQWEHFCHGKQGILPQASPVIDMLSQQMTWTHLQIERNTVYFRWEKEGALKGPQKWPRGKIMRTNRALLKKGRSPVTAAIQLC